MTRKVVIALDPSSDEALYTIEWIIENFLRPEKDNVHLISAISLNSDFDADELGMRREREKEQQLERLNLYIFCRFIYNVFNRGNYAN